MAEIDNLSDIDIKFLNTLYLNLDLIILDD